MAKTVVIIPAYKPDESYTALIENLIEDFEVLTVNDGSGAEFEELFEKAAAAGATLLTHEVNKGKGAALKTAITYLQGRGTPWVAVTADADGQHSVKDIKAVAKLAEQNTDYMVLGVRDFKKMPARSRFGNTMTKFCFYLVTRNRIMDTQTGLRGFSNLIADKLLSAEGDRYEYEMNVLLGLKGWGVPTVQTVIDTIYEEGNPTSHFHPIRDSLIVFGQVIKHTISSLACTLLDYLLYLALLAWTPLSAEAAYIPPKAISIVVNYFLSRSVVFHAKPDWRTTTAYYMLAICTMSIGAILIRLCTDYLGASEAIIKLPVDTLLFFANFIVQKKVIFK